MTFLFFFLTTSNAGFPSTSSTIFVIFTGSGFPLHRRRQLADASPGRGSHPADPLGPKTQKEE